MLRLADVMLNANSAHDSVRNAVLSPQLVMLTGFSDAHSTDL